MAKKLTKKKKSVFFCTECGNETGKWAGKCPACGEWSTLKEQELSQDEEKSTARMGLATGDAPKALNELSEAGIDRLGTGNAELDRALGGGLAHGSLILVGGDPGIGKSTLMLQTAATLDAAGIKTLYVSGEESARQIKLRASRLEIGGSGMLLHTETRLQAILDTARKVKPDVLVIDSIQTAYRDDVSGTPGSVSQLRECTLELMIFAKTTGCTTLLVGHVTKEGQIAGPRILEHIVDTVLYFEGERNGQYRLLRTVKNRFGATDEIGVFEMTASGLLPVENPSSIFLRDDDLEAPGSAVSCALEGTRSLLFEVQALVNTSGYSVSQRVAVGIDSKRLTIMLAMLEKFCGLQIGGSDVFCSVAGGLKVDDTAADLALALAIASNFRNSPLPRQWIFLGELGLSGEVRPVSQPELRLREAARLGFTHAVVPKAGQIRPVAGIQLERVASLSEAVDRCLS